MTLLVFHDFLLINSVVKVLVIWQFLSYCLLLYQLLLFLGGFHTEASDSHVWQLLQLLVDLVVFLDIGVFLLHLS